MKLLYYTFFTFLAGIILLSGCNPSPGNVSLNSEADSLSYSLGYQNGQFMAESGINDIDPEIVRAGLEAALNKEEAKLSDAEMKQAIQTFQVKARQNAQQKKMEASQENEKEGKAFLEENKSKEGIQVTESGLQYKVLEEGSGASPSAEDEVRVNYKGTLINGEEFDNPNDPVTFPLNRVISGWTEGLQLMKEGATYKFFIPGELGYGQNPPPRSPIGVNETLIFEVELLEVNPEE